jgi:predicted O-methyltransferase YrrM
MYYNPRKVIEFGVLDGYSTAWIANALKHKSDPGGHLWAYDLWEKYEYRHGNREKVQEFLNNAGVSYWVSLCNGDFFDFLKSPEPFDMLHLDISNDGNIIEQAIEAFLPQIKQGSILVFEGGSEKRDQEDWMIQYNRRPIQDVRSKFNYKIIDDRWPSISVMDKECLEK